MSSNSFHVIARRPSMLADFEVDHEAEVIAEPDAVDRVIESELCGLHAGFGFRMLIPTADEYVIKPVSIVRLTDNHLAAGGGIGIVDSPGMAGPIARHRPCIVIANTAPAQ